MDCFALCSLALFFAWFIHHGLGMAYVRRTNKSYAVGDVVQLEGGRYREGGWYRVIRVSPTRFPTPYAAAFFGDGYDDVVLKKLSRRESAVWEVMES